MRWLYYSLLIVGIWLLVIFQTSFLSAWGNWGAVMHPILWSLVYVSFFSKRYLWALVIIGGFMLDILGMSFGLNLISLTVVVLSLNFIHKYHLALHNLLNWLLTGVVAIVSYMAAAFVFTKTFGVVWDWVNVVDFTWEYFIVFTSLNLLVLLLVFSLHNLWKYFINDKRY